MEKVTVYEQGNGTHTAVRFTEGSKIKLKWGKELFTVEGETAEVVSERARQEASRRGLTKIHGL